MSNSFIAIFNKVLSAGVSYLLILAMSICLTDDSTGAFFYSFTVYTVLVQIAKAGVDMVIIRALGGGHDANDIIIRNGLYVFLFSSVLGLIYYVIYLAGYIVALEGIDSELGLVAAILSVVASALTQVFGAYFQSCGNTTMQYWAMNTGMAAVSSLLVVLYFYLLGELSFEVAAYAMLLGSTLSLCSCFIFYNMNSSKGVSTLGRVSISVIFNTIHENFPYVLVALLTIMLQWLTYLVLGGSLSGVILAEYSLSIRLSFLSNFVFLALTALSAPVISRLVVDRKYSDISKYYSRHHAISVLSATFITLLFYVYGDEVMMLFDIDSDGYTLFLCTAAWWLRVISGPVGTIMVLDGKQVFSIATLCCAVVFSLFSYFLMDYLGYVYSFGYSMLLGGGVLSALNCWYVRVNYGFMGWSPFYIYESTMMTVRKIAGRV